MNPSIRRVLPLAGSIALLLAPGQAAEIVKANNTNALELGTSWTGGVVPGPGDVAFFNNTISTNINLPMAADLSWQGIRVTNVGGTRNEANRVQISNANSANTLTLGSSGIDMGSALQALSIASRLNIGANQTWNISNANNNGNPSGLSQNEDLAFLANVANVPVDLGGFTVTKTGDGVAAFSSGHSIANGTFNVNGGVLHFQGGGSRVTTVQNTVNFNVNNGGTLRLAAQSGAGGTSTQVNAPITLNAGSTLALHLNQANSINMTNTITVAGDTTWSIFGGNASNLTGFSGNLVGAGNIIYSNTNTAVNGVLRMSGDNSGYTGELRMNSRSGTRSLRLTGPNAGSAAATWAIELGNILEVDGVGVQLGTLEGNGSIRNSHASNPATVSIRNGFFTGAITNGAGAGATTGVTKVSSGTLVLAGANTYTGDTNVTAGVLVTTTAQSGSANVNVTGGGVLDLRVIAPGTSFAAGSLNAAGGAIRFHAAGFGNPVAPVASVTTFAPQAGTPIAVDGGALTVGSYTLVDYTGSIGGGGFAGLVPVMPFRVTGSLVENVANSSLDVNLTSVEIPRWRGNVNGDWDIDPNNAGIIGTPNWATTTTQTATRYVESGSNVDTVVFDDSATGTRNVNLTTTVSPASIVVNNSSGDYTFSGSGGISGDGTLTKLGTGTLTLANSTPNDYGGATIIAGGTLRLGDGVTPNSGLIAGPIINNGTLAFSHGSDTTVTNEITGAGDIVKAGGAVTTIATDIGTTGAIIVSGGILALNTPTSVANPVTINAGGTLRLDHPTTTVTTPIINDGTINLNSPRLDTPVSGTGGILVNTAGTKTLGGTVANTFTGTSVVSAGTLSLAKTAGVNAVGGDVVVNGGSLTWAATDQVADTASITVNSGTMNTGNRADTVANVTINSTAISTVSGLNITGTLTITAGVQQDIVSSNGILTAETVALSNTGARLGINGGPSTFNIGAGGLTLNNASIVYGSVGNVGQTGTVNLGGNVTASGNSAFDVNTGNPISRLDLGGATRGFNILSGTTTVEASIVSANPTTGLNVAGPGTLVLAAGTNSNGQSSYTGLTLVTEATLLVNGSLTGSSIIVDDGGTLGGSGTINPGAAGSVVLESTTQLSPGAGPGLAGTLTIVGDLDAFGSIRDPADAALIFDLGSPASSDRVLLSSGALYIGDGELEFDDFVFSALAGFADQSTYTLFQTDEPIGGFLGSNLTGTIDGFAARLELADGGTDLVVVVPEPGSAMLLLGGLALLGSGRRRRRC